MLNAQFRPLDQWPGKRTQSRVDSQFRASYTDTLKVLEYELGKLRARDTIIQVDGLSLDDIRNDGWPRGTWKPRSQYYGVILSFDSPKGAISMPCDKFREWQDNLRAIAKSLEALRMVDRYGVTRGNEQYRGWAKLEAPNNGMSRQRAIEFIASLHGSNPAHMERLTADRWKEICRTAKIENHPDRGGSHEIFVKIGQAEEALCK